MICHAIDEFDLGSLDILFIENVGNLVCPASFDLGEDHKVAVLSVTEGEDKPLKYPQMFHAADLILMNKVDLLPHLDFDMDACQEMARRVSPGISIFEASAKTGQGWTPGMSGWRKGLKSSGWRLAASGLRQTTEFRWMQRGIYQANKSRNRGHRPGGRVPSLRLQACPESSAERMGEKHPGRRSPGGGG